MREIKFRGQKVDGEWVSGSLVTEELVDTYQVIMAFAQHFGYDRFLVVLSDKRQRLKERIEKIKQRRADR